MRSAPLVLLGLAILVTGATRAFGFVEETHYDLTHAACTAAGLPSSFCDRVGTEAFNVDEAEFTDMAAHAETPAGHALCDGANATAARLYGLGADLGAGLASGAVDQVAKALGRAAHTVEDNCAHQGVTDPEHAWYSLEDVCNGTQLSPDLRPGGLECGRAAAAQLLVVFENLRTQSGVSADSLAGVEAVSRAKAGRTAKCDFLAEAATWDGKAAGWDPAPVLAALLDAFSRGQAGTGAPDDVCGGNLHAIDRTNLNPDVDVSQGTPSCLKVHLYCLGKADSLDTESTAHTTSAGGCATATASPSALLAGLLALLGPAFARRRHRRE